MKKPASVLFKINCTIVQFFFWIFWFSSVWSLPTRFLLSNCKIE